MTMTQSCFWWQLKVGTNANADDDDDDDEIGKNAVDDTDVEKQSNMHGQN